jgi:hypothetical protein
MAKCRPRTKEIYLERAFGDVAINVNGARIEVHVDGNITAYSSGDVKSFPAAPAGRKSIECNNPKIGDRMVDGTIYAGESPDTGKAMYTTVGTTGLDLNFKQAAAHARTLSAHGCKDWRLPSKTELNVLFNNRGKIGGFAEAGGDSSWYWSSSPGDRKWDAWSQRFVEGHDVALPKLLHMSVRCVR